MRRLKLGMTILMVLLAAAAAPVLDQTVAFFAEAPYVASLPDAMEGAAAAARAVHSALSVLSVYTEN